MTDSALHDRFDFTDADLQANRAGRLSAAQQARLHAQLREATAGKIAAIVTTGAVAALFVAYFVVIPPLGDQLGPLICAVIPLAIVAGFLAARLVWHVFQRILARLLQRPTFAAFLRQRLPDYAANTQRIEAGNITAQTGLLTLRSDGEHEHLFLGEVELQDSRDEADEQLWQLPQGQAYTVYRVTATDWIVAVEQLD